MSSSRPSQRAASPSRIFVSVDMEGIAGITDRRQVWRGQTDYEWARGLMTAEADSVVRAAFDAGAERVVVNDSHGDLCNLLPDRLDERAELQTGSGKMPAMTFGIEAGFDAGIFVGYHARAGTTSGVLEHSFNSSVVSGIRVDGQDWGETETNTAVLGSHGVPLVLVAGDDITCAQARELVPDVTTVAVKTGLGYRAARSLSPAEARRRLAEATTAALTAPLPAPFVPDPPFDVEIDFLTSPMAEWAALVPGATRAGARTVAARASDVTTVTRYLGACIALAERALGI
ncbi:D-amino peptidase [Jatrophihabitans endophyticus]|uniref:D-amino peptidase n=1 Tax=Jatrophihabitans endophyticus TaxID=1206085 RepID=A0A1M5CVU5_9ACTN|nr:M55 family metallopeptidase [Jatrophihabitans endophyticus]SHF58542.1 D-amino peptidase [Jatrophihabitans endophyticus]